MSLARFLPLLAALLTLATALLVGRIAAVARQRAELAAASRTAVADLRVVVLTATETAAPRPACKRRAPASMAWPRNPSPTGSRSRSASGSPAWWPCCR